MVGEVGGVNKDLVPWRFIVDLDKSAHVEDGS
jgi:hypothetical protein